jgi:DNA-binding NarL/FixJ family response regulator
MSVRLVIVDAHPIVRWAMSQLAHATDDVDLVGDAATPAEAASVITSLTPDVVTVNCTSVGDQGWELVRGLRERYPNIGIVMLSADRSDDVLFRALEAGASAFVSKSAPVAEVMSAIRHAAVAATSFSANGLAEALRRRATATQRLVLSPREQQVLDLLQQGNSVPVIATTLYVSLSTAKTYVARLYEKLGASNRAQALMTAVRLGLVRPDQPVLAAV